MPKVTLHARELILKLKTPFGISRGTTSTANNVLVTVSFSDYVGYGEAAPSAFYGESQSSVIEFINSFVKNRRLEDYLTNLKLLREDLNSFDLSSNRAFKSNLFSASARLAIELAFWDLYGKIKKKPVYECLMNINPFINSVIPYTSFTVPIDRLNVMQDNALFALKNKFKILKIKLGLGYTEDLKILDAIKQVCSDYEYSIRVDANCGWDLSTAQKMLEILPDYHVELIEQPLPRGNLDKIKILFDTSPIPIILDEDCINISDIELIATKAHGVNIKLNKVGSLFNALEMIKLAKDYNLKIMLGCMIESSCSISAAVSLSPLVDYVDLDGHLLITNDPFEGLIIENGKILPSFDDGLGITFKELQIA